MHSRRWIVAVAVAASLLVMPAASAQTVEEPAPPSEAEAYAAQLQLGGEQVAAVGHTQAEADQSAADSSAHAGALELGPEPPPAEQLGGTQEGTGESSGAIFDTATDAEGFEALGRIAITPWNAKVTEGSTHSAAHASLLEVLLAPGGTQLLSLVVLTSDSAADYTDALSTSHSSTDGVVLMLGPPGEGLEVHILHSEASSSSGASSYVININGTKLITNEDELGQGIAQICSAVAIPQLLSLLCVQASGGLAEAAQVTLGDGGAMGGLADLFRATNAGGGTSTFGPVPEPASVLGVTEQAPAAPAAVRRR